MSRVWSQTFPYGKSRLKNGYETGRFPGLQSGMHDLELILRAGGTMAGRVTDTDGRPWTRAEVIVLGEARPAEVRNP
jgi:hypothetical protein